MLLKGKKTAAAIVSNLVDDFSGEPCLAVFHPSGDESAEWYLRMKKRWLKKIGGKMEVFELSSKTSSEKFLSDIRDINGDDSFDAMMVEMPLPFKMDTALLWSTIKPEKDVDGLTFINQGRIFSTRQETLVPCTAGAAAHILEAHDISISGKNALVIGRSNIVGLPLAKLLLNRNATVTVAHSRTENLRNIVGNYDIIAVAAGVPGIISSSDVKDGAAVVDIGINTDNSGTLTGDMEISCENEKSRIDYTPVPGGVGAVTNAFMLKNLVKCMKLKQEKNCHE